MLKVEFTFTIKSTSVAQVLAHGQDHIDRQVEGHLNLESRIS